MRFSIKLSVVALAALASAIPHAGRDRSHGHRIAHANIAARSVSYDGSCGSWSGASCAAGFCCGPNGWCGNSEYHCGAGCQSDFGQCGSGSVPQPSPSAPPGGSSQSLSAPPSSASESSVSSDSSDSGDSKLSIAAKAPADRPWQGRPTYGSPIPTLMTTTSSGVSPSSDAGTSVPAPSSDPQPTYPAPTTETTAQPSSPADSPTSSAAPTSAAPTSSETSTSSTAEQTSSYGSSAPAPTSGGGGGSQSQGGSYIKTYKGDGSSSAGWPSEDQWLSFDNLWEINQDIMKHSCSNAFSQADNSDQELADIKSSIEDVAASTGVNKAFVFVIMMQESNGCSRAPTTSYSHANPGLFQSHQGEGSCNDGSNVQNPCPQSEIHQMIEDGVAGTASGDGLKQLLGKAGGEGVQNFYRAARMYNSGSVDSSGNLGLGVATHCYCSDIANRLTGWSQGVSGCDAGTVGA